jgi:hypothetical protein
MTLERSMPANKKMLRPSTFDETFCSPHKWCRNFAENSTVGAYPVPAGQTENDESQFASMCATNARGRQTDDGPSAAFLNPAAGASVAPRLHRAGGRCLHPSRRSARSNRTTKTDSPQNFDSPVFDRSWLLFGLSPITSNTSQDRKMRTDSATRS